MMDRVLRTANDHLAFCAHRGPEMLRRVTNRLACLAAGACLTVNLLPLASAQEEKRPNRRAEARKEKEAAEKQDSPKPASGKAADPSVAAATPVDRISLLPG